MLLSPSICNKLKIFKCNGLTIFSDHTQHWELCEGVIKDTSGPLHSTVRFHSATDVCLALCPAYMLTGEGKSAVAKKVSFLIRKTKCICVSLCRETVLGFWWVQEDQHLRTLTHNCSLRTLWTWCAQSCSKKLCSAQSASCSGFLFVFFLFKMYSRPYKH